MDDKLSAMSSAWLSPFTSMLDQFKLGVTNSSVSGNPGVLGYSVSQTELVSLQHPVSIEIQRLRFQDGGKDPVLHGLGVAQCSGGGLDRHVLGGDTANSWDLPSEDYGNTQRPTASLGPRIALAHSLHFSSD